MTSSSTAARNGRRVPNPPATKAVEKTPVIVRPAATITTMIICLPDGLSREPLKAHQLDRNFGVQGNLQPRFWAQPSLRLWQRRQMFDLRTTKGHPATCVGGPARLLDLAGMRHAAGVGAGIRHQLWQQVVQGTKPAQPWVQFHTRHLSEPDKYSHERAAADFWAQPRVTAMRMHNAASIGTPLGPEELEMLQAGYAAYQNFSALNAVCGDALRTAAGGQLAPASDLFSDRVTYLDQALRYLNTIEDTDQRLIAVTL
ncbi:hypothetical protein ACQP2X_39540 [Actinoplanes sp. CA-131856]